MALIGQPQYQATADFPAELGYGWNLLAATENGNPLYWDAEVAESLTGGQILPLSTLSIWMRPHRWSPGACGEQVALQCHFDLKEILELPEAIIGGYGCEFAAPVRAGDVISHHQVLRSVSDEKVTRVGTGRFWTIGVEYWNQNGVAVGTESYTGFGYVRGGEGGVVEKSVGSVVVEPEQGWAKRDVAHDQVSVGDRLKPLSHDVTATTVVLGALASRDWRPMHHDYHFATERNGTQDIFLNTPNQLAWFERYITDWTGPKGRIGSMSFQMRDPVYPGDEMVVAGVVVNTFVDDRRCGWVDLELALTAHGVVATTCAVRVALPMKASDNPWCREAHCWHPGGMG